MNIRVVHPFEHAVLKGDEVAWGMVQIVATGLQQLGQWVLCI